ncbi:uncharacterized protein [Arachis hypogaea]|uniref:uncharacterized protein n=1 Tax=Arachis hypogaea TaxID=3818 RepID=UPI000DEC399A|nr:uncharacterized protein LOC112708965 [Arachis hypogaea]
MSSKTSVDMLWHKRGTNSDGSLRHPRDSEGWKAFDRRYTNFSGDPRNVRLALASDGFNPYGNLSSKYSIWPVILIPYNLPPWICMKQTNFILSMIILGPKMPGNDIDVYLQPLIDELKELWAGVDTYDASEKKMFKMRAALMWTISNFPGLGNLSGWNTYGGRACPTCNLDAEAMRLTFSQKWCYMGHRRFLNRDHKYRQDRSRFDGKVDDRSPPTKLTGKDVLRQLEGVPVSQGKVQVVGGKRRHGQQTVVQDESPWKKRSVFFDLPYWENNELRHNLDVMHIEKNVCDNIVFTMLNESGKSKDHLKAGKDLQLMGIRHDMWPVEGGKYPVTVFAMQNPEKNVFLRTIKNVVFPDGYSSNISRCVDLKQRKLFGLKSHDCHILMEHLLPIASKHVLPTPVSAILAELSAFFRIICSKSIDPQQLPLLQDRVVHTLCHMEMIFPPSFFTVMVHLTVHLVEEVRLGGPVHYREYRAITKRKLRSRTRSPSQIDSVVHREFANWFRHKVPFGSTNHSNELQWLACGPLAQAKRYPAYNVNGFKFRTMSREEGMKTQNSGVYVTSDTRSYASKRDANVAVGGVSYYGKLVDIIELNYSGQFNVVLFKCIWADTTSSRGIRQDVLGHTCVNFATPIYTDDREDDEPYILASEARLVFYVEDEVESEWSVVVHVKPRDLFDMDEDYEYCEVDLNPQACMTSLPEFDVEGLRLTRDGDLEESTGERVEDCDEAANS